ncbi:hypothetical protein FAE38_005383, partial [Escherichia coli]|nr:hypothetical protein [Escherichia coli]
DDVQWCSFRKSLPWIEGHDIPSMAWEFAQGVLTCETVYVVAEVDEQAMKEGVPQFVMAYIDIRLGVIICGLSGWNITEHVLRYLIVDRTAAPAGISAEVA